MITMIILLTINTAVLFTPSGGPGNFIYMLATGPPETEVARLVSPVVSSPDANLCVSFWYHMFGPRIGTLHVKQRKHTASDGLADILLWTVSGHQGNRWREGRVLVPHSSKRYQVCTVVGKVLTFLILRNPFWAGTHLVVFYSLCYALTVEK